MDPNDRAGGRLEASRGPTILPLVLLAVGIAVFRDPLGALFSGPAAATWVTIVVSVTIQAIPFLVLGVALSSAIAAFVPPGRLAALVPRRSSLAIPVGGLAGFALPGCECSSVLVAGRLRSNGVPAAAAIAFLLAAPAVNPVVLVSTAVAFPGHPRIVLGRLLASFATAVIVGAIWGRFGSDVVPLRGTNAPAGAAPVARLAALQRTFVEDVLHAGGFLVVGAIATGTLQVMGGRSGVRPPASSGFAGVVTLAVLAVVLCVCSEADAFVAASLTAFSTTARLAFMVVGPVVDLKLIALHASTFGRRFAVRFVPLVLVVAVVVSMAVGRLLA